MKGLNFDKLFKTAILVILTFYVIVQYKKTNNIEKNGRYVVTERGDILDTQTGNITPYKRP